MIFNIYATVFHLDPRTGEEKLSYKTGFRLTHDEFMIKLRDYLYENTIHPNAVRLNMNIVIWIDSPNVYFYRNCLSNYRILKMPI